MFVILNKKRLVDDVRKKTGLSRRHVEAIVNDTFEEIKETLEKHDESVFIQNFARFWTEEKDARKGRDFSSGGLVDIPARRVVKFRPSPRLRDALAELEAPTFP